MPIVYILTNQSMPETIKIGITDNLERRIKELDNTSTPLPFECYYAVEVVDASTIEKKIHNGLDDVRVRKNREFFNTSSEQAKSILEIAEVMGGKNVTPREDIVETEEDKQALEEERTRRKQRFNFLMLNLEPGTELHFIKDKTITCKIHNNTQIEFRNEITWLSPAAETILREMGYSAPSVAGPLYWTYQGQTLADLRRENET